MPRVFISYRRQDAKWPAGRLKDQLEAHFGSGNVFMDVDTLEPGEDFVEAIEQAVGSCDALVAVIGRDWLTSSDGSGRRRLDDPNDFVRLEIATALRRKVRVTPVLVDGATMPLITQLPEDLTSLARRHALELSEQRFLHDAKRLITALDKVLGTGPAPPRPTQPDVLPGDLSLSGGGAAAVVLLPRGTPLPAQCRLTLSEAEGYELLHGVTGSPRVVCRLALRESEPTRSPPILTEKILGIDLGTTNSVVSILEGGEVQVIRNAEGSRLTPSVVAFTENGQVLVGAAARRQMAMNPHRSIASVKRHMGSNKPVLTVGERQLTPQEVSAYILASLKKTAEDYLGQPVTKAVITVPAYFDDTRRKATKDAGAIAGLDVVRLVNEPTAAALAYGLGRESGGLIAVYDLGGGTFDVSILDLGDDDETDRLFAVKATDGDVRLGGDDFDQLIVDHLGELFQKETGLDPRREPIAWIRLREAAEKAKCDLSTVTKVDINIPFLVADASGPKHLQTTLTREKFEDLIQPLVVRTIMTCKLVLRNANLKPQDIRAVILVGGSTRIPCIQRAVRECFGQEPFTQLNPDEVVSMGACLQGGIVTQEVKDMVLMDVTSHSLGIETLGGVATRLIEKNAPIPASRSQQFHTAADYQTAVRVHVLQGEAPQAADCISLGWFNLEGIPPAPAGVQKIEVKFEIDVNGIVLVSATSVATGNMQSIRVDSTGAFDAAALNRLQKTVATEMGLSVVPGPSTAQKSSQGLVDLHVEINKEQMLVVTGAWRATGMRKELARVKLQV